MVIKIISRTIKTILLIFVLGVIGHFVYKKVYSVNIIYPELERTGGWSKDIKQGDIKNSKYLFFIYDYGNRSKKNSVDMWYPPYVYIINEKGEFINMKYDNKNNQSDIHDPYVCGEFISGFAYYNNIDKYVSYSLDGDLIGDCDCSIVSTYNSKYDLNSFTTLAYTNKECIYVTNELTPIIFKFDDKDRISVLKEFKQGESTIFPCFDNNERYILNYNTFYNAIDNSIVGEYNPFYSYFNMYSISSLYYSLYHSRYYYNKNELYTENKFNCNWGHYFSVQNDKKEVGYITADGDMFIDYKYRSAEPFFCGCARVVDMSDNAYFIDINENKVDAPQDTDKFTVMRKLSDSCFFAVDKQNKDTYMIDKQGKILKTFNENESFTEFVNGYCFVKNYAENKKYIMNEKGEMTVDLLKDVYPKYVNITTESLYNNSLEKNVMPEVGLSDCGLFYDFAKDDMGNNIIVFFDTNGKIQFACSGKNLNSVVKR